MNKFLVFLGSILLGCFVIPVYYFVSNYPQFGLQDTGLIIALFGCILLGIAGALWLLFRDIRKVSFLIYGGNVVFWFSHPTATYIRDNFTLFGKISGTGYQWPILFVCCLLAILVLIFVLKHCQKLVQNLNEAVSFFVLILCGLLLINGIQKIFSNQKNKDNPNPNPNTASQNEKHYPDIYHILLDAHPNQKAMESIGGDLKPFYNELEALGFVTFPESCSNYPGTQWSVASMLNMDYLQEGWKTKPSAYFVKLTRNNKVFEHLKRQGYTLKVIGDKMVKAYYSSDDICNEEADLLIQLYSIFERTPIKHIYERLFVHNFIEAAKNAIQRQFEAMRTQKNIGGGATFVYAHILCPHEPCIFSSCTRNLAFSGFIQKYDISYLLEPETHRAFCENVYGIDSLVLETIKEILKRYTSETGKPIIVLHSDHSILYCGIDLKDPIITTDTVYGNLLAIYIPDEWKQDAKDLKFINLYRWIFNHLFGDKYAYFEESKQM